MSVRTWAFLPVFPNGSALPTVSVEEKEKVKKNVNMGEASHIVRELSR